MRPPNEDYYGKSLFGLLGRSSRLLTPLNTRRGKHSDGRKGMWAKKSREKVRRKKFQKGQRR